MRKLLALLLVALVLWWPTSASANVVTLTSPYNQYPVCGITSDITKDRWAGYVPATEYDCLGAMPATAYSYIGTIIGTDYFGRGDNGYLNPSPADVYRVRVRVTNKYNHWCLTDHYADGHTVAVSCA